MKKKVLCMGTIGLFLLIAIGTSFTTAEKIESSNEDKIKFNIRVNCEDNRPWPWSFNPRYTPDEIETEIEIRNLNTDEITVLTNEDMSGSGNFGLGQNYFVDLEEDGDYNIKCSIELNSPIWTPTEDYQEVECYNVYYGETVEFFFDSECIIKSKSKPVDIISMIVNRLPILQRSFARKTLFLVE